MIRALLMIAAAGFVVSLVTLSAAVGITGPDKVLHGAWTWGPDGWGDRGEVRVDRENRDDGPHATRDVAWSAGDTLKVELPADVQYTQAPGPAKMTITGPRDAVDDVEFKDGEIRYRNDQDDDADLKIVIQAPSVTHFAMESSGSLKIENYKQDVLAMDLEGSADADARGETKTVRLTIEGSADANFGEVKAEAANVTINGSGNATIAPSRAADIGLSGSGDVTLLSRPLRLQAHVSGSGKVIQKGD
jgi:hypothetical protein